MDRETKGADLGHVQYLRTVRSGKAMIVEREGESLCIPFSQVHNDSEVHEDDLCDGKLVVTQWLADKEGWD